MTVDPAQARELSEARADLADLRAGLRASTARLSEVTRERDTLADRLAAAHECIREHQAAGRAAGEALELIVTWTAPGCATPETIQAAHDQARRALGLG